MSKELQTNRRVSAKERARLKKLNVFKTAVPLVLTVLLLAVVYVLVLLPDKPELVLKRSLYNSLDQSKQKSWRYDGSFGDKDNGFSAEYSGQKAQNGDNEFFLKLMAKDLSTSYHITRKGNDSYYLVSGATNLSTILSTIPGAKLPDQTMTAVLASINDTWIKVPNTSDELVQKLVPCSATPLLLPNASQLTDVTDAKLPLQITGGPYSANNGTQSRVFEVGLKKGRAVTDYEVGIGNFISCLDGLRNNDFRLRKVSSQDVDIFKVSITVDPLSNTVSHVVYKAFGQYFQLNLRDYNKDVTVNAPDTSITLDDTFTGLNDQLKQELSTKYGFSN